MADDKQPITIKKYANRRLYNTGTSAYVTLEDLAQLVKSGEEFLVFDAKTGEDITRSVLAQIIFEQEGKAGQSLLPINFLRQLIRFYGDSMQMVVPSYLTFSLDRLTADQQSYRDQMARALGGKETLPGQMFGVMEDQARKNMAMFNQALAMFNPFIPQAAGAEATAAQAAPAAGAKAGGADLDEMRKQLEAMQKQIEALARKT